MFLFLFLFLFFRLQLWLCQMIMSQWRSLSLREKWGGERLRSSGSKTRRIAKSLSASAVTDCSRKPMNCLFFVMLRLPSLSSLPAAASTSIPTIGINFFAQFSFEFKALLHNLFVSFFVLFCFFEDLVLFKFFVWCLLRMN